MLYGKRVKTHKDTTTDTKGQLGFWSVIIIAVGLGFLILELLENIK